MLQSSFLISKIIDLDCVEVCINCMTKLKKQLTHCMEDQNHKVSSLLTMKLLLQELYRNKFASSFIEGIIILQFL